MSNHFCTCPVVKCGKHPQNQPDGCDPCVKSNMAKLDIPTCFFRAIHEDVSGVTDYSIEGFVNFYQQHRDEYLAKKTK